MDTNFFTTNDLAPHLILTRIAAILRIFSADSSLAICAGFRQLKESLKPDEYNNILAVFNPIQQAPWPTPTYTPVLLNNLFKKTGSYELAVVLGLPLIVRALDVYGELFKSKSITMPLNFNALASANTINRIVADEKFEISVNCETGDVIAGEIILSLENVQTQVGVS